MIVMAVGSNAGALMILVVGKTILDLGLHLRERDRNATRLAAQQPTTLSGFIPSEPDRTPPTPRASEPRYPRVHSSSDD
jgi:hypothetical protein